MKTHLPVALRKALIAAIFSVSAFAYNKAYAEVTSPDSVLEVTVSGNNETHEYDGDIKVAPMDSASGYDGLNLHAGNGADDTPGNITIESTATTLYNPEILAEGNITIGVDSEGNVNEHQNLIIRGSGSSVIEAGGDLVFNHRVDAAVGQDAASGNGAGTDVTYTGTLSIKADGDITFDSIGVQRTNVSTIRLAGGNTENDMATMSAGGNITVKDAGSSELAWTRYSKVSAGGDIDVQLPFGNGIFSGVVDAEGDFSFSGANFTAMDPKDTTPSITAGTGISVYTSSLNTVSSAELLAEQGDIELISNGGGYSNYIYQAKATANDGDVRIESSNGRAYMISSVVDSDTGNVGMTGARVDAVQSSFTAAKNLTLAGTSNTGLADVSATADTISVGTETGDTNITSESELENVHSSLTATGDIDVKGSRVNISDDATIRSHDGSVSIKAYGEYEEDPVTHNPMGGVNIREAEVEAQGDISITGAAVVMTDASAVSVGGAVPVTGETDFVSGADSTPPGTVSIGGSVETTLKGVEVDGGSLAIGNASGTTTLGSSANDGGGATPTTLDATGRIDVTGTTVSLNAVSVDATGTDADGVSVSITGDNVEVSGENVTGSGAVTIAGTASTTVNGVAVDGGSISVGADGTTSISNASALNSAGDIAVKGDSVGISDSTIASTQGNVSVIADNGDATITGDSILADGNVQITAAEATNLAGAITATSGSLTVEAGTDNTINTALTAGTDVSVSAGDSNVISSTVQGGDSVTITATDGSNELKDAVTATEGTVTVVAGTDNTISAEVQGKTDVSITAEQGENKLTGATVTAAEGSLEVNAGTDNTINAALSAGTDVSVTAGGSNTLSSAVSAGEEVSITAFGANNIKADVVAGNGSATFNGGTANVVEGTETDVTASNGAVQLNGGINLVDAATLVAQAPAEGELNEKAGQVIISGDSNVVRNSAEIQADAGVTMTSTGQGEQAGNLIAASTVQSDGGSIAINADNINRITDSTVQTDIGNVSFIGGVANIVEGSTTEVSATDGSIELKGSAAVTNLVDAAGLNASGDESTVSITGASNVIRNDATVQGEDGVTISSTGTDAAAGNVISGSAVSSGAGDVAISAANINMVDDSQFGAAAGSVTLDAASNLVRNGSAVEAGAGITITSTGEGENSGNQVSGSTLQATGGSIAIAAKKSNHVTAGADIAADAGAVTLSGEVNVVDSASTITGQDNVTISGSSSNSITGASAVKSTTGNVFIDGDETAENSISGTDTLVSAGAEVDIDGKVNVISDGASVEAGDMLSLESAEYNALYGGAALVGGTGIEISSTSAAVDHGNLVDAASLTATTGDISITAARTNKLASGAVVTAEAGNVSLAGGLANVVEGSTTKVNATDGSIELKGGAAVTNLVDGAGLNASGDEAAVSITGASNVIRNDATVQGEDGVTISSTGTDAAAGNVISGSAVSSGAGDVAISAANINLVDDSALGASTGTVTLEGESNLVRNGSDVEAGAGITITSTGEGENSGNLVSDSALTAKTGDVALVSEVHNHVTDAAVLESESGKVSLTGGRNIIMGGSSVLADGDVVMTASELNAVHNAELKSEKGNVIIGDEGGSTESVSNAIVSADGQMVYVVAGKNVRVAGKNVISGENFGDVNLIAGQGDITLSDDNEITHAVIDALGTEGDVVITTGTGDKGTTITNTGIYAQTVTIAGDTTDRSDANLAVVTGEGTRIMSRGAKDGVGLTLNNVSVLDTQKGDKAIRAMKEGDIVILNRVDVENGTLTIDDGATSSGRIVVDAGNVLNARVESSLEGRLTGAGDINKSGGDSLLLNYDHTGFTGSIYANGALGGGDGSVVEEDNAGSWIEISGAGVGAEASIVLKNTDLVISTDETQIGTLDTTQDSDANAADTGNTLLADGSYTADGNNRTDFTTVGSVLEVNKGNAGDVVQTTDMKLSDATLIKLDAAVNGAEVESDVIKATGTINAAAVAGLNSTSTAAAPSTARVYINHADLAAASNAEDGARTTIMTGNMATAINEDVLYDVALSDNGTYQRTLQDRNMHLENSAEGVDLVISKNYRSCAKDAATQRVAEVIADLSDDFHHTEGTLAAGNSTLERLIDAFDYTRSEAAAVRGLQSVAGFGNVLPRLMQFDSSRHHLSSLRRQMALPVCPRTWKGTENRTFNTWITYTGAQDDLNGDANMDDYSRTANGFLLGVDRSLTCNLRVGASLGYETSSSSSGPAKVDGDTFFLDAYAVAVTGQIKHRVSVGLASSTFDMKRGVAVEAGYHTFSGQTKSSVDGLSLNFGYELSSDYLLDERSYLTRYLTANLSWHQLDDMKEAGLGNVGVETSYDDEWQADIAIGVQYNREFAAVRHEAPARFYAAAELHLDFLNEQVSSQNRFRGSSAGWEVKSMKRDRFYAELGAGVIVPLSPAWTATAGAAVEVGSEHTSVSGDVGVRYSF